MSTSFILNPHRFGAAADPGLTLLQGATLWLDASDDIANSQWIRNKGTGGRSLDAREGSVGSAQVVKGVLKLPGVAGNNATSPDSAALSSGSVDVMVRVAASDWTTASNTQIVSKWDTAVSRSWCLYTKSTGRLGFTLRAVAEYESTSAVGFADGQAGWIRVTFDSATGNIKFYTAADSSGVPGAWTQLGTTVAGSAGALGDTTTVLTIGDATSGAYSGIFSGNLYRVRLLDGYDGAGSVVFDADFTAVSDLATSFTESSSNAATVTINSTTGVDTNDPLLLTHTGTNYLYLPGISGNNATTPDAAALDITDDLEIVVRARLDTVSANGELVAKWASAGGWSYVLRVESTNLVLYTSSTGSSAPADHSYTVAHGVSAGTTVWFKATRVRSTGVIELFKAADQSTEPSSWTSLGSEANATTALWTTASILSIGSDANNALPFQGAIYRAIVRNGIGGTTVFDADFTANTNQSSFTESSSNAATVTINRSTSGRKAVMVTRPVWLFGTDDYMEIADNALLDVDTGERLTALIVMRDWATVSGNTCFVVKYSGAFDEGWGLIRDNTGPHRARGYLESGASNLSSTAAASWTAGALVMNGLLIDRTAQTVATANGSTIAATSSIAALGTLANTGTLRVGRNQASGDYLDGEVVAVALFKGSATLTSTELGQIATYYGV